MVVAAGQALLLAAQPVVLERLRAAEVEAGRFDVGQRAPRDQLAVDGREVSRGDAQPMRPCVADASVELEIRMVGEAHRTRRRHGGRVLHLDRQRVEQPIDDLGMELTRIALVAVGRHERQVYRRCIGRLHVPLAVVKTKVSPRAVHLAMS